MFQQMQCAKVVLGWMTAFTHASKVSCSQVSEHQPTQSESICMSKDIDAICMYMCMFDVHCCRRGDEFVQVTCDLLVSLCTSCSAAFHGINKAVKLASHSAYVSLHSVKCGDVQCSQYCQHAVGAR